MLDLLWAISYIAFVWTLAIQLGRLVCGPPAWWGRRPWLWWPAALVWAVLITQLLRLVCGPLPDVMPS